MMNRSIIQIGCNKLVQMKNSMTITNKIIFHGIEDLFNEAFYLINNKHIEKGRENFLFMLENEFRNNILRNCKI